MEGFAAMRGYVGDVRWYRILLVYTAVPRRASQDDISGKDRTA